MIEGFDVSKTAKHIKKFFENAVMLDKRDFNVATGSSLKSVMEDFEKDPTSTESIKGIVALIWIGTRKYIENYSMDDAWIHEEQTLLKVMNKVNPTTSEDGSQEA